MDRPRCSTALEPYLDGVAADTLADEIQRGPRRPTAAVAVEVALDAGTVRIALGDVGG